MRLEVNTIIGKLKKYPWRKLNIEWTVVFGGLVERGFGEDVDILVSAKLGGEEKLELALSIADFLNIPWDHVDIVLFSEAPCPIIMSAWRKGIIVYAKNKRVYREQMLAKINVCLDYALSFRKLDILSTATKAIKRKLVK